MLEYRKHKTVQDTNVGKQLCSRRCHLKSCAGEPWVNIDNAIKILNSSYLQFEIIRI